MRPWVALRPKIPVMAAGTLIEPPVSVPIAPSTRPAATATAEPPEEPPGRGGGVPGVADRPEPVVLAAETVGELMKAGAGDHHRSLRFQSLDTGADTSGTSAVEPRATGGGQALLIDDVLDGHCQVRQTAVRIVRAGVFDYQGAGVS